MSVRTDTTVIDTDWPAEDLQWVAACPACDSAQSTVLLADVQDLTFHVAPGRWTMRSCGDCGIAYLNPRPSPQSIGRAYERYYTHEGAARAPVWRQSGLASKLKVDYLNRKYGYRFPGGIPVGHFIITRAVGYLGLDDVVRHLPAPAGAGERLLDIGCGDGEFVRTAAELGFEARGIDPDPKAVATGRSMGLAISVGLFPDESFRDSGFDHVTMSHVLEHLHEPRAALAQIFDILKPGGRVWLTQPNLGAIGLREFGKAWRGLEAPRHLSLYHWSGLERLLRSIGFQQITLMPSAKAAATFYYRHSAAMAAGVDPYSPEADALNDETVRRAAAAADAQAAADPTLGESLTVIAFKPDMER
jgi:2-polyprenyl-3-methyl-5-hydroxy-6-metoxy-1,4-benzoquinol methylase